MILVVSSNPYNTYGSGSSANPFGLPPYLLNLINPVQSQQSMFAPPVSAPPAMAASLLAPPQAGTQPISQYGVSGPTPTPAPVQIPPMAGFGATGNGTTTTTTGAGSDNTLGTILQIASIAAMFASDRRIKVIGDEYTTALNDLGKLTVSIARYTHDVPSDNRPMVMADEVQDVFPHAVIGDKQAEHPQLVNGIDLIPVLIAAVKELSAKIDRLETPYRAEGPGVTSEPYGT